MDREIRIIHTADTHLGYKQYHNEVRRKDFFKAFEQVINDAVEMQVDAVVHAGDLFDSRNPTLEDLLETINILSRLKAAEIPFFGIVGNHESKQNTQWLDLFEEMGLAARLGKKPRIIENIAVYGIDSVPRSKIPSYDYSDFEVPDPAFFFRPEDFNNYKNILVMHQIVQPFPYAEWDCAVVLENLPFKVDAILLGDYHKFEKFPVGEAWATYPGSTERNSVSEADARTYNIVTFSEDRVEISRRPISTRRFVSPIKVELNGEENPHEQAFSKINERLEELPDAVVFLEISGDSKAILSLSEIEEYILKKGALVANFNDKRTKEILSEEGLTVTFSDPDHAVADEIKRMNLNDGGLIVDEIIRSLNVPKSRVDEETENRLLKLVKAIDFKNPDFSEEVFSNFARLSQPPNQAVDFPPEIPKSRPEIPELAPSKPIFPPAVEIVSQPELELSKGVPFEPESQEKSDLTSLTSKPIQTPVSRPVSRPASKSLSELQSSLGSDSPSFIEKSSELSSESSPEPFINPIVQIAPSEKLIKDFKDSVKELEASEVSVNMELKEENPQKLIETPSKKAKIGQKKGKGKVAPPRQFNLGDYL